MSSSGCLVFIPGLGLGASLGTLGNITASLLSAKPGFITHCSGAHSAMPGKEVHCIYLCQRKEAHLPHLTSHGSAPHPTAVLCRKQDMHVWKCPNETKSCFLRMAGLAGYYLMLISLHQSSDMKTIYILPQILPPRPGVGTFRYVPAVIFGKGPRCSSTVKLERNQYSPPPLPPPQKKTK